MLVLQDIQVYYREERDFNKSEGVKSGEIQASGTRAVISLVDTAVLSCMAPYNSNISE